MTARPRLPYLAYEQLVARDGEKCHDCGEGPPDVQLDVEHNLALWKGRFMSAPSRAWLNSLANMVLRCRDGFGCHKHKTRREAAERAHQKRLEAQGQPERAPLVGKDGQRLA